jgi:hypothetical protein
VYSVGDVGRFIISFENAQISTIFELSAVLFVTVSIAFHIIINPFKEQKGAKNFP